jgi:hypothetical protein
LVGSGQLRGAAFCSSIQVSPLLEFKYSWILVQYREALQQRRLVFCLCCLFQKYKVTNFNILQPKMPFWFLLVMQQISNLNQIKHQSQIFGSNQKPNPIISNK